VAAGTYTSPEFNYSWLTNCHLQGSTQFKLVRACVCVCLCVCVCVCACLCLPMRTCRKLTLMGKQAKHHCGIGKGLNYQRSLWWPDDSTLSKWTVVVVWRELVWGGHTQSVCYLQWVQIKTSPLLWYYIFLNCWTTVLLQRSLYSAAAAGWLNE